MKGFGKRDINVVIMFVLFFIFFTIIYVSFWNEGFIPGTCPDTTPTDAEKEKCKKRNNIATAATCNGISRKPGICKKY